MTQLLSKISDPVLLWAGIFTLAVGTFVLLWSLWWDRSRGRRRCPKCWYDMSGTDSLVCSECGYTAKREKKLRKTRRRWRWTTFAFPLILMGASTSLTPRVRNHGIYSIVPTTFLIASIEMMPSGDLDPYAAGKTPSPTLDDYFREELDRRATNDTLYQWQWRWLVSQCCKGDDLRQPPFMDWYFQYARFLRLAAQHGHIDPHSHDHTLTSVKYGVSIQSREHWPQNSPIWIIFRMAPVFDEPRGFCYATLDAPGGITALGECVAPQKVQSFLRGWYEEESVGIVSTAEDNLTFHLNVPGYTDWNLTVTQPITVSGEIGDLISPEENADIQERFENAFFQYSIPGEYVQINPYIIQFAMERLQDTTMGIRLEVYKGNLLIGTGSAWWASVAEVNNRRYSTPILSSGIEVRIKVFNDASQAEGQWQLRIVGDPEVAIRDFLCTRYWRGEAWARLRAADDVYEERPRIH